MPSDYPDIAFRWAGAGGAADRGVLLCGTGVGMSIRRTKSGVYAAHCHDTATAKFSRLQQLEYSHHGRKNPHSGAGGRNMDVALNPLREADIPRLDK